MKVKFDYCFFKNYNNGIMETILIDTLDDYIKMNITNFLDSSSLLSFTDMYPQVKSACKQFGTIHEIKNDKIDSIYLDMIIYDADYTIMERAILAVKRYFGTTCNIKSRIKNILKIELQILDFTRFIKIFSIFYQLNKFLVSHSCFCMKVNIKEKISEIKSKHILLELSSNLLIPLTNIDDQKQKADLDMNCFFQNLKAPYVFSQGVCICT